MIKSKMEPQAIKLAMFPLRTFLLPGEEIPLKIFEPKYIELITECEQTGMPFGIPYVIEDTIAPYGCEVELQSVVAKNSLNEMVVIVKCIRNFHLLDFYEAMPGRLYGGGVIEYIDDQFETNNPELAVLAKKLKLDIHPNLGSLVIGDSIKLFDVAKALFLKSDEKYKFYALRNQIRMEKYLIRQLRFYEVIQKQEEILQNNFSLN